MKFNKFILWVAFALFATTSGIAHAQFSVIRGVNPSNAFVNLNSDASGNIAVNCVIGCGASAGTGGLAANGAATSGNPVLVAGYDGTLVRTELTDSSGRQIVNVNSLPSIPTGANTIGAVTISGTPAFTVSGTPAVTLSGGSNAVNSTIVNTPAVTLASTTLSGTTNNVIDSPTTNSLVDKSGTITTGGTSQTLSTAKSRHYLFIQNQSSANLYINFTTAAVATGQPSIMIPPQGSFVQEGLFVSSEQVNIIGATTGQAFAAKEF